MIPSPFHSSRGGKKVRLICIHTAEGARTVASLGSWFQRLSTQASSHAGIDDSRLETFVDYSQAAWTLRSGNPISDNVELCGFAAWSRAEWLRHPKMLELTAQWIRARCQVRGVPIRKLTPAQVAAGQAGVIGHIDWTLGMRDGSHTDPGSSFPWDVVMQMAGIAGGSAPSPTPVVDDLEDDVQRYYAKGSTKPDIWLFEIEMDPARPVSGRHVDGAEWGLVSAAPNPAALKTMPQAAFDALVKAAGAK